MGLDELLRVGVGWKQRQKTERDVGTTSALAKFIVRMV